MSDLIDNIKKHKDYIFIMLVFLWFISQAVHLGLLNKIHLFSRTQVFSDSAYLFLYMLYFYIWFYICFGLYHLFEKSYLNKNKLFRWFIFFLAFSLLYILILFLLSIYFDIWAYIYAIIIFFLVWMFCFLVQFFFKKEKILRGSSYSHIFLIYLFFIIFIIFLTYHSNTYRFEKLHIQIEWQSLIYEIKYINDKYLFLNEDSNNAQIYTKNKEKTIVIPNGGRLYSNYVMLTDPKPNFWFLLKNKWNNLKNFFVFKFDSLIEFFK